MKIQTQLENKKLNNVLVLKEQDASQLSLKPTYEDPPEYKIDFCHAIPVVRSAIGDKASPFS